MAGVNGAMRAATIAEAGAGPTVVERPIPNPGPGQALVEVITAALNPADLFVASGRMPLPRPLEFPYVPGAEGCGIVRRAQGVPAGTRVRFGAMPPHGSLAEYTVVPEAELIPVPDDAPDDLVAALGMVGWVAWFALTDRGRLSPGERVLVLGATGSVGQVAVQLARLLGAGRVVAAGRDAATLDGLRSLGADATVQLGPDTADLASTFAEATGGGPDVVVDTLWGDPAIAALTAAAPGARLVNVSDVAARAVPVPAALLRFKGLVVSGYTSLTVPAGPRRDAFDTLLGYARRGDLTLAREEFELDRVAEGWQRVAASAHQKLVIRLAAGADAS